MSADILVTSSDLSAVRYIRLPDVKTNGTPLEDLADYVRRVRNEKGLSLKDVENRSNGDISKGYVGQIENQDVLGNAVTPKKLKALAQGLGVAEEEITAVAFGRSPKQMTPKDFYEALEAMGITEFSASKGKLTPDEMQDIVEMVRATVGAKLKRKQKK